MLPALFLFRRNLLIAVFGILSSLCTLYVASHQFLVILRWLPLVQLVGATVPQLLPSLRSIFSSSTSKKKHTPWLIACFLGVATGAQHTLFVWSFLKLPPACAVAIQALADPITRLSNAYAAGMLTAQPTALAIARFVALIRVVSRVVPMNYAGLTQGLLAMSIGVTSIKMREKYGLPSASQESTGGVLAIIPAAILAFRVGPSQFGLKYYIFRDYVPKEITITAVVLFALYRGFTAGTGSPLPIWDSLTMSTALIMSAFIVTMKERIAWIDVIALGIYVILTYMEIRSTSGEATTVTGAVVFNDAHELPDISTLANGNGSSSQGSPSKLPLPLTNSTPQKPYLFPIHPLLQMLLIATGFIFIIYALTVQACFIPNSWRWDARPYHLSTSLLFSSQEPAYLLGGGPTKWSALPHTVYSSPKIQARREGSGPGWVPPQLEVVISYYDEAIEGLSDIIFKSYAAQPQWTHTSTLYHKGLGFDATGGKKPVPADVAEENLRKLMNHPAVKGSIDTGIVVKNEGREGGTYLKHIIDNYDRLADFTIFMQAHVPWPDLFEERLKLLNERTGFLSFGLYVTVTNGKDNWGNGNFPRMGQIWSLFQPTPYRTEDGKSGVTHLSSYHGVFGVSRERIMRTPKHAYEQIYKVLTAPADDPIYQDKEHWKGVTDGPENPFFGHALERAWTLMLNCIDPGIETACHYLFPASASCYCPDDAVTEAITHQSITGAVKGLY